MSSKVLAEVYSPINYLFLDPPARDKVSLRSQCYLGVCRIQEERGKMWKIKLKVQLKGLARKATNACWGTGARSVS
jgi:hypothetical protein